MNPRRTGRGLLIFGLAALLGLSQTPFGGRAWAQSASAWVASAQSAVRLISPVEGAGDLDHVLLGLEFTLKPGWKTYWRSPGEAGLPASVDLAGSSNASDPQLRWPAPHRFQLFGLQTFGYQDHVLLPLEIRVPNPGQPISIRAQVRYLVCEVVCIPLEAALSLDVPSGPARPSAQAALANQFNSLVPTSPARFGWQVSQPALREDGAIVIDVASSLDVFHAPDVVIEHSPTHAFLPPEVSLDSEARNARLVVRSEKIAAGPALNAQDLVFTIFDGARAGELTARPALSGVPASSFGSGDGMLAILAIAFLGGLILNVMPCVLPVLILKLTGVLEMSGHAERRLRMSFLASAAGIMVSFLALAGLLSLAKASGAGIGWGIQFQQPLFLAAMAAICLAFAANLFGLFEVPMPAFVGRASLEGERRASGPHVKAFLSGVLATALATPCSAPFVGTAVAFALARGPLEIFSIFAAMATGLAAPYLMVAAAPKLIALMPRPGPWMVWVRRLLGFSLLATALWLASIIGGQLGWSRAWVAIDESGPWVAFDQARIDGEVANGRLVFVDVTADWCLTCQANKKLVLDQDPVASRLAHDQVLAMRADWTNPDPAIADFLVRFGRYGIPLNVVFGPNAPTGIALPELLTSDSVIAALGEAGGALGQQTSN